MVVSTLLEVALWLLFPGSTAYCHHSPSSQAVGGLSANGFVLGAAPTRNPHPANVHSPQPGLASPGTAFGC